LALNAPGDPNVGRWVIALTCGYTHKIYSFSEGELNLGGSVTNDLLPSDYQGAYGGNPWSGKLFVQMSAMKMWDL